MSNVTICSLVELGDKAHLTAPDVVVSAVRTDAELERCGEHIDVHIDDIYNRQLASYKNALRRVLGIDDDKSALIHCEHGRSRSAALACALVYKRGGDVGEWLAAHPQAEPNPLLLLLADEMLGADGALLRACRGRYKGWSL